MDLNPVEDIVERLNSYPNEVEAYELVREAAKLIESLRAQVTEQTIEIEQLKELDVRKIMVAVVPGDGSGHEVYATSMSDVEDLLAKLSEKAEDYDLQTTPLRCQVAELTRQRNEAIRVISETLVWDAGRKFILPYRIRDPLINVVNTRKAR